jgi:hypothetical protein
MIHNFCQSNISKIKSYRRFTDLQFCAVLELLELQFKISLWEIHCLKYVTQYNFDILNGECYRQKKQEQIKNTHYDNNRFLQKPK